jgi:cyclopropane-fatty-acyl-phospholipid synthase
MLFQLIANIKRYFLVNRIKTLPFKSINIIDENGEYLLKASTDKPITLNILDSQFYSLVVDKGELGFGIAFTKKYWDTDNLPDLCLLLCSHMELFDRELNSSYSPRKLLMKHKEVSDDKQYIMHHYDIGNDFYELFLDSTFMSYSVGLFIDDTDTIETSMKNKLDYIIDKLEIQPTDTVLDIGCGWGLMSRYIKETSGCKQLDGITVSHEQINYVKNKNLSVDGLNFIEIDYRDHVHENYYDKIYSMEMLEHVGRLNLKTYFEGIAKNLKVGGKACILSNVLTYEKDNKGIDAQNQFILNEIYPGGSIPKISFVMAALNDVKQLRLRSIKMFDGYQYSIVFRYWTKNLVKAKSTIVETYGEELFRAFQYYLASVGGLTEANTLASAFFILEKVDVPL